VAVTTPQVIGPAALGVPWARAPRACPWARAPRASVAVGRVRLPGPLMRELRYPEEFSSL